MSALRLQLLSLARRFVPEAEGQLTVIIKAAGFRVTIEETAEDAGAPAVHLPPVERAILRVATESPQTAKALARLAGYKHGTHFRDAVTALCRKSLLVRTPDGYQAASPANAGGKK